MNLILGTRWSLGLRRDHGHNRQTRKVPWGRSGNRCEIGKNELVIDATPDDDESVIARTSAASSRHGPQGPRSRRSYRPVLYHQKPRCAADPRRRVPSLPERMMVYQETFVRRDQHRIYVREYPGEEPTIILMHRFPDNLHLHDDLFLISRRRVESLPLISWVGCLR